MLFRWPQKASEKVRFELRTETKWWGRETCEYWGGGFQAEGTARTKARGGSTLDQAKEQQGGQCVWREVSQGTAVGDGVRVNRGLVM